MPILGCYHCNLRVTFNCSSSVSTGLGILVIRPPIRHTLFSSTSVVKTEKMGVIFVSFHVDALSHFILMSPTNGG